MVKVKKVYDKSKGLHSLISEVVHGIIPSGNFSFNPPESRTWRDVQQRGNAPEKDRLEYLGDAVMYLGLAHELYRKYPNKTAGFYTNVRSALSTNITFMLLMKKAGLDRGQTGKMVADEFEAMVAALFLQDGLPSVMQWLSREFAPLIVAAERRFSIGIGEEDGKGKGKKKSSTGTYRKYAPDSFTHSKKLRNMKLKRMQIQDKNGGRRSAVVVIDLTLTDDETDNGDGDELRSSSPVAGPSRLRADSVIAQAASDSEEHMASRSSNATPEVGPSCLRKKDLKAIYRSQDVDADDEDDELYGQSTLNNLDDQARKKGEKTPEQTYSNPSAPANAPPVQGNDGNDSDSDGSEDSLCGPSSYAVMAISRSWLRGKSKSKRSESRRSSDGEYSCSMSISSTSDRAPVQRRPASEGSSVKEVSSQEEDVQEISMILLAGKEDEKQNDSSDSSEDSEQANMLDDLEASSKYTATRRLASRLTSPSDTRAPGRSRRSAQETPREMQQRTETPESPQRRSKGKSLRSRLTSPVIEGHGGTRTSKPKSTKCPRSTSRSPSPSAAAGPCQGTADDPIFIDDSD